MKIVFSGDTKKIPDFQEYEALVNHASKIFGFKDANEIGVNFKLFYQDDENDIISISGQSDLEEACRY
jgi:hypothetical protein